MVVSAGEVREAFVSSELADEPLRDVSLLDGRLSVGALGTSAPVSDDTLGFISGSDANAGASITVFASWG